MDARPMDAGPAVMDIVRMRSGLQQNGGSAAGEVRGAIRFDRNEVAGAFGDMGTDLPLIVGMIVASGLDPASVLVMFGAMQVATGVVYRMPMPVQPLKAVAAIVIAHRVAPGVIFGGGLAIGVLMLVLAATGLLSWIGRVVPHPVIRGLQLGLGIQLTLVALRDFVPALGPPGYLLAALSAAVIGLLIGNRRLPPAPIVIALGVAWALAASPTQGLAAVGSGFALPQPHLPRWPEIASGFLLLALPQIPLSIGNSVLATDQLAHDLFPARRRIGVRRIGITYGLMNVVVPFLSGVPVCHGSGGMAGHYAHGGRTGGSVVLYGSAFVLAGLLFSGTFATFVAVFPRPVLGVLLIVEGVLLVRLLRDLRPSAPGELPLAILTGFLASLLPYGYLVAIVAGTGLSLCIDRLRRRAHAG